VTLLESLRSREPAASIDRRGVLAIRPVIVDTSALVSDVYWELLGHSSQVLAAAELGCVRLFAPTTVYYEVYENLPKLAAGKREGRAAEAQELWEKRYLPLIRWCAGFPFVYDDEPVVGSIPDEDDRPLAALARAIAPCRVWSDNYKHLAVVGVTSAAAPTAWRKQAGASARAAGVASMGVMGSATMVGVGAGIKELVTALARRPRVGLPVAGLVLVGGALAGYRLGGQRAAAMRRRIGSAASTVGEGVGVIVDAYKQSEALLGTSELVSGIEDDLRRRVGHLLAVSPRPLLMREIAEALAASGGSTLATKAIGGVLRRARMFRRGSDSRWQLGYFAAPLPRGSALVASDAASAAIGH
jgi:hypothetical protein